MTTTRSGTGRGPARWMGPALRSALTVSAVVLVAAAVLIVSRSGRGDGVDLRATVTTGSPADPAGASRLWPPDAGGPQAWSGREGPTTTVPGVVPPPGSGVSTTTGGLAPTSTSVVSPSSGSPASDGPASSGAASDGPASSGAPAGSAAAPVTRAAGTGNPSPTTRAVPPTVRAEPTVAAVAPATGDSSTTLSRSTTATTAASVAGPASGASSTAPATRTPTTVATTTSTTAASPTTAAPPTGATLPEAGNGGAVVWADEFDTLDRTHWALEHSTYGDGNGEVQCYRPENVSVDNGRLVLRARAETSTCPNGSTRPATSGMVRSRGVTLSPGQAIEVRVKLTPADPSDQGGLWPAVWASGFGGSGGWPRSGEIDMLEVMTATDARRSIYSIHYAKPDGSHGVTNKPVVGSENFSARWHTVRFEYGTGGRLVWQLDGQQVFAVSAATTLQGYPAPFDQPIREIKLNLALGGRPGPLAPGALGATGATFEIDYVRITTL